MADESMKHAGGLAAATEKSSAAHAAAGAEQDVCDAQTQQIRGMTSQALREREAGPAAGFPPPNDDESTEHALAAARADTTAATHDQEEFPEHEAVPQPPDALATATETSIMAAGVAQYHQDSEHQFLDEDEDEYEDEGTIESARRFIETVGNLRELDGYADDDIIEIAVAATQLSRLYQFDDLPSYRNGGFGAVPASAAAVAGLEKRIFHAGGGDDDLGGCAICLEGDYEEGQELSVMPCSQAHAFHTQCTTVWLGQSNICPLCRHPLPVSEDE